MKGASYSGIVIGPLSLCNGARTENLVAVYVVESDGRRAPEFVSRNVNGLHDPLRSSHERACHH